MKVDLPNVQTFSPGSLERARNAAIRAWSRLEAHTPFGMRRDDLDELRHRLHEANRHVSECETLVAGWTELADREIGGRKLLNAFEADLRVAIRAKEKAEAALKRRLRDIFVGAKGRPPTTDQELDEWLASAEGKAATAFEPTSLPASRDSSRRA
jgi:hypothetical protein